jgi:exopolysaccharide biosynthesis protein
MSYGYAATTEYQNPFLIRTFVYDSPYGSSSIQSYSRSTFGLGVPNVIGGLDVTAAKNPSGAIPRTFVGVRDDNGDTKSETVIFFSSQKATQATAASVLGSFGAGSKMMLDGGSSTGLIVNGGTPLIETKDARVPQAFVIYTGK